MMDKQPAEELLKRYLEGRCTPAEEAMVESWYVQRQPMLQKPLSVEDREIDLDSIWNRLEANRQRRIRMYRLYRVAAAAMVLLVLGMGGYWLAIHPVSNQDQEQVIGPGGDYATLKLANGAVIQLQNAPMGQLVNKPWLQIKKSEEGKISYQVRKQTTMPNHAAWNTIETPRGGQYRIDLPDGTRVWLNAASSLRFPAYFEENERVVELSGEAYLEVAQNQHAPFRVRAGGQLIDVLGTAFNVSAYRDEPSMKTTLVEGSIRVGVHRENEHYILKPGEQAERIDGKYSIKQVNLDEATDWTKGYFTFHHTDIQTAMLKIAKWYDVEVSYQGKVDDLYFGGSVLRSNTLLQTLKILESTGNMKFKLEGRRVMVMP